MRTRSESLLIAVALLGATPARAQGPAIEPRWLAYVGCWEPVEAVAPRLCVVPAAGPSAVDFVSVVNGQVVARERIAATGARLETTGADCAGWRSAEWSSHGQRIYLRSADDCDGRVGTGLIAMSGNGQWLYIQSATVAGQTGLRVQQYRAAAHDTSLPGDVAAALRQGVSATTEARAAAAAPLSIDDIVEASRAVDAAVLEAWLVERAEPFTLNAKRLVALADAGVPAPVIDLMVALSYPKVFAINPASRRGARRAAPAGTSQRDLIGAFAAINPLCSPLHLPYTYGYDCTAFGGYGYRYGYGYDAGWYPNGYPVIIVHTGPAAPARPHGRVVNGRGYTQPGDQGADAKPRSVVPSSTSSGWSSTGSSPGTSSSGSTSSSGTSEQRTAKPRPQ